MLKGKFEMIMLVAAVAVAIAILAAGALGKEQRREITRCQSHHTTESIRPRCS